MATKQYICPKCGNQFDHDPDAQGTSAVCPHCATALDVVGDFAYVPVGGEHMQQPPEETPPPFEPEQIPGTATDPLLPQARKYLATCNAITVPMLMHYFSIDAERATQLMQALEQTGAVAPSPGGAPHTILIPHSNDLPFMLNRTLETDQMMENLQQQLNQQGGGPKVRTIGCNCGPILLILLLAWLAYNLLGK